MKSKSSSPPVESPLAKEVRRLHANGKPPEIIAIRLGVKISRVLQMIPKV